MPARAILPMVLSMVFPAALLAASAAARAQGGVAPTPVESKPAEIKPPEAKPAEPQAPPNECRGEVRLSEGPAPSLGRIADPAPGPGAGRVNLLKDGVARAECPGPGPECRERAYLVPGDRVVVRERRGAYVCATYVGPKDGADRTGWLPAAAVAPEPPAAAVAPADWLGTWSQIEAGIRIRPAPAGAAPGTLAIDGDATWGGADPARVARGAVHVGGIQARIVPQGETLSFAMGDDGKGNDRTLPVDGGGEFACRVWMRRLGPWLLVDDNLSCGGANVSFRGLYRRDREARGNPGGRR